MEEAPVMYFQGTGRTVGYMQNIYEREGRLFINHGKIFKVGICHKQRYNVFTLSVSSFVADLFSSTTTVWVCIPSGSQLNSIRRHYVRLRSRCVYLEIRFGYTLELKKMLHLCTKAGFCHRVNNEITSVHILIYK